MACVSEPSACMTKQAFMSSRSSRKQAKLRNHHRPWQVCSINGAHLVAVSSASGFVKTTSSSAVGRSPPPAARQASPRRHGSAF